MAENIRGARVCALVGPQGSGKTTLLEALLLASGAIHRKGKVADGNSVGDSGAEARARGITVETNLAQATYLGETWTFLDCPGSVEFAQETRHALSIADVAVVVADPDPNRAALLMPLFKWLDDRHIPHMVFLNRVEQPDVSVRAALEAMQAVSERPLVLREVPVREDGGIVGYVDLVSERAYRYRPGQASELVTMPGAVKDREAEARQEMLERLADFDDALLEKLLEEIGPGREEIYADLTRELAEDHIVPVFFGSAEHDAGIRRLLKALRHETPEVAITALRLGIDAGTGPLAQTFKVSHGEQSGRLSMVRVWSGEIEDGMTLTEADGAGGRVAGIVTHPGGSPTRVQKAGAGEVVSLARIEGLRIGGLCGPGAATAISDWPEPLPPLFATALRPSRHGDDVRLSTSLARLAEEDPSLTVDHNAETGDLLLWGQGDIHLAVCVDRLKRKFNVEVTRERPSVPYKETIRRATAVHGRHKRQTGGHGQFGDVKLRISPLPRGAGFEFRDSVVGGVVPRQYIPSVEAGIRDYMKRGPLGFPVVDFAVELHDGSYHTVDSSDMAFRTAAQIAMREGMPDCDPVLLEPILHVEVDIPAEHTSRAQRALSTRRGQILAFGQRDGWKDWDRIEAHLPQAEMHDLILELRSATRGLGSFRWRFDHLSELTGRQADNVVGERKSELQVA